MKTLLIVDDEHFMRRLLQFALVRTGARILLAENGHAALAVLASEPVDLMVIDVNMPGIDGFATVAALRADAKHATLPVIMMTAGGLGDVRSKAAELGVAAFFTKPFSPAALAEEAKRLLEHSK
ncbi:MAG: response regulator [Burkholderiales bacterium]|nr:response regulator [Opitutaceae bacterium]